LPLSSDQAGSGRLTTPAKVRVAAQIVTTFIVVRRNVHRRPLPELARTLARQDVPRVRRPPHRLANAVDRTLRLGRRRPTCLVSSLVLFRLLRAQGDAAELVIGLPASPRDKDAHAWVELERRDVGPSPGRNGHVELARYP
jgi:Transglutaminase-like superfamily